jgi:hypothetical protein
MPLSRKRITEAMHRLLGTLLVMSVVLAPEVGFSSPTGEPDLSGIAWTIKLTTEQTGKQTATHTLVYSMTPDILRIDQPGWKGFDIIIWRLDLHKVYALDTEHKTYREEAVEKVLSYQNFSDLIGQHAGNNPGDVRKTLDTTMTVGGYTCHPEQILHKFRGTVVGMINGDQETIVCNSGSVQGFETVRKFQENLSGLSPKKSASPPAPSFQNTFSLYLKRTTHYQAGFIVKLLHTIGLYDLSKIPSMQREEAKVTDIRTTHFSQDFFNVPAGYRKIVPKAP